MFRISTGKDFTKVNSGIFGSIFSIKLWLYDIAYKYIYTMLSV